MGASEPWSGDGARCCLFSSWPRNHLGCEAEVEGNGNGGHMVRAGAGKVAHMFGIF